MRPPQHTLQNRGFTLIEVTLALGVSAFCLLAIFGLLPVGLRSNQAAIEQTAANRIISEVAADLRATPSTSGSSALYNIPFTTGSSVLYFSINGQYSPSLSGTAGNMTHRLVIALVAPSTSATTARLATMANLQVTWPAAATPANAAGSVTTFVALNRN